jgi:hypothetical protein
MVKEWIESNFKVVLVFLLATGVMLQLFFLLSDKPGRYVRYGDGDIIMDTQTSRLYIYDVQTMELKPFKLNTVHFRS